MEIWEMLLAGVIAALVIFLFTPGIKQTMQKSREAESDWKTIILLAAILIGFVILMIYSVSS